MNSRCIPLFCDHLNVLNAIKPAENHLLNKHVFKCFYFDPFILIIIFIKLAEAASKLWLCAHSLSLRCHIATIK